MAKVISLINQKGGAGKTASTNALSVCLKHRGYRVLSVDFDPQGYLTFSMGADAREHPTVYDVLKREVKCRDAVQQTSVGNILASDALLGNVEREFAGPGGEGALRDCLSAVSSQYDYILIDSPPQLGLLSVNALVASNAVLVPGLADGYSLQGIIQVQETIVRVQKAFNPNLKIGGMFLVRYYPREALSRITRETAEMLAEYLHMPLMDAAIRHSSIISKAMTSLQRDIVDYAPTNNAVLDYQRLTDELFERGVF